MFALLEMRDSATIRCLLHHQIFHAGSGPFLADFVDLVGLDWDVVP